MESKETYSSPVFGKPDFVLGRTDEPIRSSSANGYCASAGTTMEACLQNLRPSINTGPNLSSPPVAMSLRTREASSLVLKQIFDHQQRINGASSSAQRQHRIAGFQEMQSQSMLDLHKCSLPNLDLTFKKAEDCHDPRAQTGFGSPISTPTHQSSPSPAALIPINGGQLLQRNVLPQSVASARINPSSRQSTAQMTVFYSGHVNVYDDVPADKAHAIMLLAGNSWSSSFRSPAPSHTSPVSAPEKTAPTMERSTALIRAAPLKHTAMTSTSTSIAKSFALPSPSASAMASLGSPPPSPALQTQGPASDGMKSSQAGADAAKRQHVGIELPHARKASLARFLEKRKDRQVQQEDPPGGGAGAAEKGAAELSSYGDEPERAASSSKKPCIEMAATTGPSSPYVHGNSKADDAHDHDTKESVAMSEHRFFHRRAFDDKPR